MGKQKKDGNNPKHIACRCYGDYSIAIGLNCVRQCGFNSNIVTIMTHTKGASVNYKQKNPH